MKWSKEKIWSWYNARPWIRGCNYTLLQCVKKAIGFGIPEKDAFDMASKTPAELLGLNKGKLEQGYDADIIVTDENYNIIMTGIAGELING